MLPEDGAVTVMTWRASPTGSSSGNRVPLLDARCALWVGVGCAVGRGDTRADDDGVGCGLVAAGGGPVAVEVCAAGVDVVGRRRAG